MCDCGRNYQRRNVPSYVNHQGIVRCPKVRRLTSRVDSEIDHPTVPLARMMMETEELKKAEGERDKAVLARAAHWRQA